MWTDFKTTLELNLIYLQSIVMEESKYYLLLILLICSCAPQLSFPVLPEVSQVQTGPGGEMAAGAPQADLQQPKASDSSPGKLFPSCCLAGKLQPSCFGRQCQWMCVCCQTQHMFTSWIPARAQALLLTCLPMDGWRHWGLLWLDSPFHAAVGRSTAQHSHCGGLCTPCSIIVASTSVNISHHSLI